MTKLELHVKSLDSTNDYLKENHQDLPAFTIIRADHQLKGRGQFDRVWESAVGENLLVSILLKDVDISKIDDIKFSIVDSLLDVLSKYDINARFKAPNDLYVEENKIAGILIETKLGIKTFDYVVIGIGLNINQTLFCIPQATSFKQILNMSLDVVQIYDQWVNICIERLKTVYEIS